MYCATGSGAGTDVNHSRHSSPSLAALAQCILVTALERLERDRARRAA